MTNLKIQSTLQCHGVTSIVTGDKIMALDEYTIEGLPWSTWIDVTGFTGSQLRNFLGYDHVEDINYN
jgi:hypothetical protein